MLRKFLIAAAVISLLALTVSCGERVDYTENWDVMRGRYSSISGSLIKADPADGKDMGITFSSTSSGGVAVEARPPEESPGCVATAVITSKAKTPLDGLCIDISADDADLTMDQHGRSEVISVLWSDERPVSLELVDHYDHTATNGIRNIVPGGKGLCITVNNTYVVYNGTATASNVMITLIDGDFIDAADERLGYRWSFTARNNLEQSPNTDGTGIRRSFERIDLSDGLSIKVRADETHGFIVSVNGKDYYSSADIAYYPNNVKDWMSAESMTVARGDIDLTPLAGYEGYVSVGFCGTADQTLGYKYTVERVNGTAAASWNG